VKARTPQLPQNWKCRKGAALPAFGGEFYAVNLASLDDASDSELSQAPINYPDGRADDWQKEAAGCRYL